MAEKEKNTLLAKKFLLDRKSIKLEDCMMYVEEYKPADKNWFYHLCMDEVPVKDKDGNETGEKAVLPFLTIKKAFYDKYFPASGELSKRMKLFADWGIED